MFHTHHYIQEWFSNSCPRDLQMFGGLSSPIRMSHQDIQTPPSISGPSSKKEEDTHLLTFLHQKSGIPARPKRLMLFRLEVKRGPSAHQGSAYSSSPPRNGSICNPLLKKSLTVCGGRSYSMCGVLGVLGWVVRSGLYSSCDTSEWWIRYSKHRGREPWCSGVKGLPPSPHLLLLPPVSTFENHKADKRYVSQEMVFSGGNRIG